MPVCSYKKATSLLITVTITLSFRTEIYLDFSIVLQLLAPVKGINSYNYFYFRLQHINKKGSGQTFQSGTLPRPSNDGHLHCNLHFKITPFFTKVGSKWRITHRLGRRVAHDIMYNSIIEPACPSPQATKQL